MEKGCRVEGYIAVTKVQGHMYIVPSRVNDLIPPERLSEISSRINVTHTINQFSFGDDIPVRYCLPLFLFSYFFIYEYIE